MEEVNEAVEVILDIVDSRYIAAKYSMMISKYDSEITKA